MAQSLSENRSKVACWGLFICMSSMPTRVKRCAVGLTSYHILCGQVELSLLV